MTSSFQKRVYKRTREIPQGKIATYQSLARAIDSPHSSRAVGNALNKNPFSSVPCHRVIRSDGSVGGYARGAKSKIRILRKEGIEIDRGHVDLRKFSYTFKK